MKMRLLIGLFSLAVLGTSCDKHKDHYGTYDAKETRSYTGVMMPSSIDLSDQNYLLTVKAVDKNNIMLKNLYEHGTQVQTEIDGSALTIRKQSLDGFLDVEGNGTIGDGVINLNYSVITPDGNVVCDLNAGKIE